MAYSDITNSLKSLLEEFSAEEEKLSKLYQTALNNAEASHRNAVESLNAQYEDSRKQVYSDNLRDERNTNTLLAERGLGFSGEAAQAKLNSNIILANRLGALERENLTNAASLELEHAERMNTFSLEQAEKIGSLNDKRNQFRLDIASLEQEAAENEADRLFQKQQQEAQNNFDKEQLAAQIQAEKEAQEAERLEKQREKDLELQAQIERDKAETQREQQKLQAQLNAEREALDKKLQAEKDMQEAELLAKYYNTVNGGSGTGASGTGGSNGSGSSNELSDGSESDFTPDISAKDLAKLIVSNATDNNYIDEAKDEYLINKYLLDLIDSYNMSDEYLSELKFMLKAYGYKDIGTDGMRNQVISYDAASYYDTRYSQYYESYTLSGMSEAEARQSAREYALNDQMDYIRVRTNGLEEFINCCLNSGISERDANQYALSFVWPSPDGSNEISFTGGGKPTSNITNQLK